MNRRIEHGKVITKSEIWIFGLFFGFGFALLITIVILHLNSYVDLDSNSLKNEFPLYRGMAWFIFFIWIWGLDCFAWTVYHIDYKLVLGFNEHYSDFSKVID